MRAPLRGFESLYFCLICISPGISASARIISFCPNSAKSILAGRKMNNDNDDYRNTTAT